jgi:hypothetical protein
MDSQAEVKAQVKQRSAPERLRAHPGLSKGRHGKKRPHSRHSDSSNAFAGAHKALKHSKKRLADSSQSNGTSVAAKENQKGRSGGDRSVRNVAEKTALKPQFEDEDVTCDYIYMQDTEQNTVHKFKLFKEKDVPFLSHKAISMKLKDVACDYDCPTEDDQAQKSALQLKRKLTNSISSYLKHKHDVTNVPKYVQNRGPHKKPPHGCPDLHPH